MLNLKKEFKGCIDNYILLVFQNYSNFITFYYQGVAYTLFNDLLNKMPQFLAI